MKKTAFFGSGNMGSALAGSAAKTGDTGNILVTNRTFSKAEALADKLGCRALSNREAAAEAEILFLCVKPQMMEDLFREIRPVLTERKDSFLLVSIAAGLTSDRIRELSGTDAPVVRLMPNTPAAVGEGVLLYSCADGTDPVLLEGFREAVKAAGRLILMPERLIDAGGAVAGCGPAFACLFIEALADGGVACGLPRAQAVEMAEQMLLGTAKLAIETGDHPGAMKDAVCSPGGSTIQGVRALEDRGFRSAVMEAVIAAYNRNGELAKS